MKNYKNLAVVLSLVFVSGLLTFAACGGSSNGGSSSGGDDLSDYFTAPERVEDIVYVVFNEVVEFGSDAWATALFAGLVIASESANLQDMVGVGMALTSGQANLYYVDNASFTDWMQDRISTDDLIDRVQYLEFDL